MTSMKPSKRESKRAKTPNVRISPRALAQFGDDTIPPAIRNKFLKALAAHKNIK